MGKEVGMNGAYEKGVLVCVGERWEGGTEGTGREEGLGICV